MSQSTLFKLNSGDLKTEAEVETRLLAKLFAQLGYPDTSVIPKDRLPALIVNDGSKKTKVEVDFLLKGSDGNAKVIVEAKDPSKSIQEAWGQAASYALGYGRDKKEEEKIKWLLISNGHITSLFKSDSDTPTVTLQLSDFASGSPVYSTLKSYIKYKTADEIITSGLRFEIVPPDKLNDIFTQCHNLIWKREKLNPTDAFFEFCKFIFIKIQEDKKRDQEGNSNIPVYKIPMTLAWLDAQQSTSKNPIRDILFIKLRDQLEGAIHKDKKKRIFEKNEILKLSATTCKELVKRFETINLSSIDEDLNGRMFEVFLNAAVRGRALGQYFTPRPVVDFMTRIALYNFDATNPPKVIDACSGTAGFLIEVMAYLISGLKNDTRLNQTEVDKLRSKICNESLYGIEANERVARIARINMYLHGDGGSHIFHGDGLATTPQTEEDMSEERMQEVQNHAEKILPASFDLVLTNPPFSMTYERSNEDEEKILDQRPVADNKPTVKSNVLFLDRYYELLKPGGQMLIVLDDTVLNGKTQEDIRKWMQDKFIILGVHSLPFNAFFKAKANIKTSILHLKKKEKPNEAQGHIFMSISNNIGHNNALEDTPNRNNLTDILVSYLEWKRTGKLESVVKENQDGDENLECPEQIWLVPPSELTTERFDAFFYCPDLKNVWKNLELLEKSGQIERIPGSKFKRRSKLGRELKLNLLNSKEKLKYVEISDVTKYGLITSYITDTIDKLPSRGDYQVHTGDILLAINNSSRGTIVLVPKDFENAICTSGFLVIIPQSEGEACLLWYALRSEFCRKQLYYLAQTASQPELKLDAWNNYFIVPMPKGALKKQALEESKKFQNHIRSILDADKVRLEVIKA